MLGNNEKIPGVNIPDLFAAMVGELPWRAFNAYIAGNTQLMKVCTLGGNRIQPEKRPRLEKQVINEAAKSEYSEMTCNAVFAVWYPVHAEIHEQLESYFKSDEYKAYRTEQKLTEEDYVLPGDKFQSFFQAKDIKAWKILLVFSPLKFTQEQADAILNNTSGDVADLAEQVEKLQAQLADAEKKAAAAQTDADRVRKEQQADAAELQELKKAQRQNRTDLEALNQKLTSLGAENRRLTALLSSTDSNSQKREQEAAEAAQRNVLRLQAEADRLKADLNSWQNKYQEQLLSNRQIVADSRECEKRAAQANEARELSEQRLGKAQKFVDLLLSRVDWSKLGSQLKLTPTIRRNFNSLIKRLNYETDLSLTIEETLPQFWTKHSKCENELITKIANSNTLEVEKGDMTSFWSEVQDAFAEVQSSLEARLFMVSFLQELLGSVYTMDQLETPTIPVAKKKSTE